MNIIEEHNGDTYESQINFIISCDLDADKRRSDIIIYIDKKLSQSNAISAKDIKNKEPIIAMFKALRDLSIMKLPDNVTRLMDMTSTEHKVIVRLWNNHLIMFPKLSEGGTYRFENSVAFCEAGGVISLAMVGCRYFEVWSQDMENDGEEIDLDSDIGLSDAEKTVIANVIPKMWTIGKLMIPRRTHMEAQYPYDLSYCISSRGMSDKYLVRDARGVFYEMYAD